jgi:hypothetical protein
MSNSSRIVAYCTEPYTERWAFAILVLWHLPHYEQQSQNRCLMHRALHCEVKLCIILCFATPAAFMSSNLESFLTALSLTLRGEPLHYFFCDTCRIMSNSPRIVAYCTRVLHWEVSPCCSCFADICCIYEQQSKNRCLFHRSVHWEGSLCITCFATPPAFMSSNLRIVAYGREPYTCPSFDLALTSPIS